jgi:hypothetical protein
MNKATITTAIAVAILALSPAVTNADHRDTETESMFGIDSHCFVRDNNDNQIKLDHFWQFTPDYKPTSHSGTSSRPFSGGAGTSSCCCCGAGRNCGA